MEALIIGGGIGGPAAALALQQAGIQATVYESHDGPAESLGLFLGIGVNGLRVLRSLGLVRALFEADTIPTPLMVFRSTTGRRLGSVSNGWLDHGTPSPTVMRGTLQKVLSDEAVSRGVEIQYGKRLVAAFQHKDQVVAWFSDGTEAVGNLLVGADGIRSCVRAAMNPDSPEPSYTGLINLGGIVRASQFAPTPGEMHMLWGRRAFFGYTVRPTGEAWWFANVGMEQEPTRESLAGIPDAEWRGKLRELFREDPPFVRELIHRTERIGATPIHDMPSLPFWHRGRMVLLGDAAHAVSPSAGQGASMALEDALALAKCLRECTVPEAALATYEEMRRPRTEKIVAVGRRRSNYKALKSRAAVVLRDLFMPIAFKLFATEKAMSWIYDYEIEWAECSTDARPAPGDRRQQQIDEDRSQPEEVQRVR